MTPLPFLLMNMNATCVKGVCRACGKIEPEIFVFFIKANPTVAAHLHLDWKGKFVHLQNTEFAITGCLNNNAMTLCNYWSHVLKK